MFTKNVLKAKDFTNHNLQGINDNKTPVALKGDRDSRMLIMKKALIIVFMHQQMVPLLNI